jgi:hypothetical protein
MFLMILALLLAACEQESKQKAEYPNVDRESKIPADITKRGPDTDQTPPILHSAEFEAPVPLPYPVSTAGAEDSPFILPDGGTLYFFFTPDVRVPPERQILDEVTGIWVTLNVGGTWSKAQRVWLEAPGKLSLDGAVCVQGSEMWFASAREGYTGVNMFTAELVNGKWVDWKYSGDRLMKEIQIGEVHIHYDALYFHSARAGGKGDLDLWLTTRSGGSWTDPVNLEPLNTVAREGYPFVSTDGNELWFTRTYLGTPGIFRSKKSGDTWGAPELIVSQFAGEPTLDDAGNLYFVHHFYENGTMIEADISLARKR